MGRRKKQGTRGKNRFFAAHTFYYGAAARRACIIH
jgi:hypothetical protein